MGRGPVARRAIVAWAVATALAVLAAPDRAVSETTTQPEGATEKLARERDEMVRSQIERRGVSDGRVLAAMRKVPRHLFVPETVRGSAYIDSPLPIGWDQTISQPFVVAAMSELLRLDGSEKVLEIGTGSGYQAAILGELAREVYTIEIVEPLAERAAEVLSELGYANVHVRAGDGYRGWPEQAPFDAIILTAAPPEVPAPLVEQLAAGGILVAPIGDLDQDLVVLEKTSEGLKKREVFGVRFVPMTGEAQRPH